MTFFEGFAAAAFFFAAVFAAAGFFSLTAVVFVDFFASGYASLGVVRKERVMFTDANRGARDLAKEADKRPVVRSAVR